MKTLSSLLALQSTFIATVWCSNISPSSTPEDLIVEGKVNLRNKPTSRILNSTVHGIWPKVVGNTEVITDKFKKRENNSQKQTKNNDKKSHKNIKLPVILSTSKTLIGKIIHDHEDDDGHMPPFVDMLPPGPFFDFERSGNVTALVGRSAKLNCRVNQIGNRTVSWLRDRDTHLLTVGRYTYTSDQRFRAEHIPGSEDWPLTVKFAQVRDSGLYECQVSTTPPMRHYIWLNIVEPRTRILGGPDVYINRGSSINLTCVVDYTPQPPLYVIWKHNNQIISYDSDRGGVSVVTEKGPQTSTNLLIRRASGRDSGTYSCNPSSAPFSTITVHILNGEHPAAMQHGGHSPHLLSYLLAGSALTVLLALC